MKIHEHKLDEVDRLPIREGMRTKWFYRGSFWPEYYRHDGIDYHTVRGILRGSIGKTRKEVTDSLLRKVRKFGQHSVSELISWFVDEVTRIDGKLYFTDSYGRPSDRKTAWRVTEGLYFKDNILRCIKLKKAKRYSRGRNRIRTAKEMFIGNDHVLKSVLEVSEWRRFSFPLGVTFKWVSQKKSDGGVTVYIGSLNHGSRSEYLIHNIKLQEKALGLACTKDEYHYIRDTIDKYKFTLNMLLTDVNA